MASGDENVVGSVAVKLVPDARGWDREAERQLAPQAEKVGKSTGQTMGKPIKEEIGKAVKAGLSNADSEAEARSQGGRTGRALAEAIKVTLEAALRDLPEARIDADTSPADQSIADLRERIEALRGSTVRVNADTDSAEQALDELRVRIDSYQGTTVRVGADTAPAERSVTELQERVSSLQGTSVRLDVDASEAHAQLNELRATLDQVAAEHPNLQISVDAASARAELDSLLTQVRALGAESASIRIEVDSTRAEEQFATIQALIESMATQVPTVRVDVDTARADEQLAAVMAQAAALGMMSPTVHVDADTAMAEAQIAGVGATAAAVSSGGGMGMLLTTAVALGPAIAASAAAGMGALAGLGSAAAAVAGGLGVAILALKPVLAAKSASDAASDASSSGSGAAQARADAIKSANDQIKDSEASLARVRENVASQAEEASRRVAQAQQGVKDAEVQAAESIKQAQQNLADAHKEAAASIAQAQEAVKEARQRASDDAERTAQAVKDAQQGVVVAEQNAAANIAQAQQAVRDARQRAADDAERAAQAVKDAQQGVAEAERSAATSIAQAQQSVIDAHQQAAQQIQSANDQVVSAEQSLAQAQDRARTAQDQLNASRVQAVEDLKQLQFQTEDAALAQRGAALSLERAQIQLAKTRADPKASQLERAQAQLAYDQANQSLKEQTERARELAAQNEKAQKAGVEGSERVKSAQERLAEAQQNVIRQQQNVAKAQQNAAAAQVRAAQLIATAEQRLVDAQIKGAQAIEKAQQRLAQARKDQSRIAQDDARKIADAEGKVAQAQAKGAQAVEKAQERLARARQTQSRTAIADAQRIQQAEARVADARSKAQAQIASAQQRLAQTESSAQQRIAKARQAVADAQRAQAQQAKQGAYQVAQAEERVQKAQEALQKAYAKTGATGSAANKKLQDSLAKLSPAGLEFMNFLKGMKGGFDDLSKVAQTGFLPGLERGLKAMSPLMGPITNLVRNLSTAMGGLAEEAGKMLGGPGGQQFVNFLADNLGPWLVKTVHGFEGFVSGFAKLWMGFKPVIDAFLSSFEGAGKAFSDWSERVTKSKGFKDFMQEIIKIGPVFGKLLLNITQIVGKLVIGLAPLGGLMLKALVGVTGFMAKLDPKVLSAIAIAVGGVFLAFKGFSILASVAGMIVRVSMAFGGLTNVLRFLVGPAGIIIALAAGFVYLYNHNKTFHDQVNKLWKAIGGFISDAWTKVIRPAFDALVKFINNNIIPAMKWLWEKVGKPVFTQLGGHIRDTWVKTIQPALKGLWDFIKKDVGPAIQWLWEKIGKPYFKFLGEYIKFVWEKLVSPALKAFFGFINNVLGPVIGWLWSKVVRPTFEWIGSHIKSVWERYISPALSAFKRFMQNDVGPAVSWLWNRVIKPTFQWIGDHIRTIWNRYISPALSAFKRFMQNDITTAVSRLWNNSIKPTFKWIGDHIKWVWEKLISPVFGSLRDGLGKDDNHGLRGAFHTAVAAIAKIWDGLKKAFKDPINAVVDIVNNGFIGPFDAVADKVGLGKQLHIGKLTKLASGGVVPGPYLHDRADNVLALSDAGIPVARVNPGEMVIQNPSTRSMERNHPGALDYINRHGTLPGYADGGLVGSMFSHLPGYWPGGNVWDSVKHGASGVWDTTKKAAHAVTHPVETAKKAATATKQVVQGTLSGDALKLARVVKFAMQQVGRPYVYGAAGPHAFDCSGLTSTAYRSGAGVNMTHLADAQARIGRPVSRNSIQPGDLVFPLPGHPVPHVAIAVTPNMMVEAANPRLGVIGPHAIPRNLPNGARRILGDVNPTEVSGIVKGLGAIDMVKDAYSASLGWMFDRLRGVLDKPIDAVTKRLGDHFPIQMVGGQAKNIVDGALDWASSMLGASSGGSADMSPYTSGGNFERWWSDALKVAGPSYARYKNSVGTVAQHESGMNPNAINNWDSNARAGHPSQGLMQFIPSTFAANAWPGHNSFLNPVDQILAYFKYSTSQYGGPDNVPGLRAMRSGGSYRGYGIGTTNALPGVSLLGDSPHSVADDAIELVFGRQYRTLKGGEQVYNESQLRSMSKPHKADGMLGNTYNTFEVNCDVKDLDGVRSAQEFVQFANLHKRMKQGM